MIAVVTSEQLRFQRPRLHQNLPCILPALIKRHGDHKVSLASIERLNIDVFLILADVNNEYDNNAHTIHCNASHNKNVRSRPYSQNPCDLITKLSVWTQWVQAQTCSVQCTHYMKILSLKYTFPCECGVWCREKCCIRTGVLFVRCHIHYSDKKHYHSSTISLHTLGSQYCTTQDSKNVIKRMTYLSGLTARAG